MEFEKKLKTDFYYLLAFIVWILSSMDFNYVWLYPFYLFFKELVSSIISSVLEF